ncbi:MAG TPA: cytidylate kinase family protein [Bryobacteraceae bacterium]|nr:cytidylate kinase family protein [Bryobacteraceae bacterium]
MALIAVSGQAGCRFEEVARLSAHRLAFELVNESRVRTLIDGEFGAETHIPEKARGDVVASILAHLAAGHHLIYCGPGAEMLFRQFPGTLRIQVVAPDSVRIGNLMLDRRLERPAARQMLRELDAAQRQQYKDMFGRALAPAYWFDLILNAECMDAEQMVELIQGAVRSLGLKERGHLSPAAEAQIQFQIRLRLARHGIVPRGAARLTEKSFAHQSEQIFANLLDFYRIAWEYEPRSFPIQWDAEGRIAEAFTPDFYLPEFDLYVELTTMKQSLVTRKNRKIRLLRELYPHLNVQVFYQKDFENLIFKYGLAERPAKV